MISRRGFIGTLTVGLLAAPLAAEAQKERAIPNRRSRYQCRATNLASAPLSHLSPR